MGLVLEGAEVGDDFGSWIVAGGTDIHINIGGA